MTQAASYCTGGALPRSGLAGRYDMTISAELREQLLRPHSKPSLSFPRELREQLERDCGFTDEEITVLRLCGRGWCYAKIADEQHCSVEVIKRRVRSIKNKIANL